MVLTKEDLISFEEWCIDEFHKGNIRSPMHLSGGNEEQLIEIFKEVKENDWIFSTYRSHYHALLKGVPIEWLKKWILENKSIHVMNKEYKIVSSAIVGGTLSQAVGCAMAIKMNTKGYYTPLKYLDGAYIEPHVWAFCGDMTATLGVFKDCVSFVTTNDLPITFVVEDNGMSTDTPTHEAWGIDKNNMELLMIQFTNMQKVKYYKYERTHPHYGTGKRINFETKEVLT